MKKKKSISTHYVAAIIIFICAVVISLGAFSVICPEVNRYQFSESHDQ